MKRRYFGTDGVRGPYGGDLINPDFAARLAEAAGRWAGTGRVLVGRDTRASGEPLLTGLARGFAAAGWELVDIGVLPTPAVARQVRVTGAELGVVITASHNPAADNGIKFFGPGGVKLTDAEELAIEAALPEDPAVEQGSKISDTTALDAYVDAMAALLPDQALSGWKIVLDSAHGATVMTSPVVLERLGAQVVRVGAKPDGTNINAEVGSEHPEQLADRVKAEGARLGVAHDGDGDRCVVCDETGQVLDGDEILTILATDAIERRTLPGGLLVVTQQSNLGVDAALGAAGGRVLRTAIGDRYVAEAMRTQGAVLGGESSGHIIDDKVGPTGDGLGAALRLIAVMLRTGQRLSVLRQRLNRFPQRAGTLSVAAKPPLEDCPQLTATMAALENELGSTGRLLVRYSGTEPKLRLLVEGSTDEIVDAAYDRLAAAARADLA
jgi:phosphoglucosamine mutase